MQLFDVQNPVNLNYDRLLFSTEGHLFPVSARFHAPVEDIFAEPLSSAHALESRRIERFSLYAANESCERPFQTDPYLVPLPRPYMQQFFRVVGVAEGEQLQLFGAAHSADPPAGHSS